MADLCIEAGCDKWIPLKWEGQESGKIHLIASWASQGQGQDKMPPSDLGATSPPKQQKKSPYTTKQKAPSTQVTNAKNDEQVKGVPAENMPPADYKPDEDKQNADESNAQAMKGSASLKSVDSKKSPGDAENAPTTQQ